ncbi:MAG: DUF3011 domain-containing protein [Pseudomonadota bacterium]
MPEPTRAAIASGGGYVVGEGRFGGKEPVDDHWTLVAIVDFDDRLRHVVSMVADSDDDIARCRKDAVALLDSMRREPGWVPRAPAGEPDEPSVEDLTLLNGKAGAVELVWCESKKKQRQRCPADTSAGVVFVGRASFVECEEGKSFWIKDDAIVVDKGCRARFAVRAASASPASPT